MQKNKVRGRREDYNQFISIPTRWMDNDMYGHVNNVQYYSFFDTAVNRYLIDHQVLDIHQSDVIGLVVETQCGYYDSLSFPDEVSAGLRVRKIGTSSVRYELGLFKDGDQLAAAEGFFVHVYVKREDRRPTPISAAMRAALEKIEA